jgi:hypothetical protein
VALQEDGERRGARDGAEDERDGQALACRDRHAVAEDDGDAGEAEERAGDGARPEALRAGDARDGRGDERHRAVEHRGDAARDLLLGAVDERVAGGVEDAADGEPGHGAAARARLPEAERQRGGEDGGRDGEAQGGGEEGRIAARADADADGVPGGPPDEGAGGVRDDGHEVCLVSGTRRSGHRPDAEGR